MPAAARVLDDLMGLLAVESVNHAPPSFQTRGLSDLNAALQEIYSLAPTDWWLTDDRGVQINAPTSITITTTSGSKAATLTGYQTWMLGCTIIIDGDPAQNAILSVGSSNSLKLPYTGSSGSHTAIVYHDKVTLDADTFRIVSPVALSGGYTLFPVDSRRPLNYGNYMYGDYGAAPNTSVWANRTRSISTPSLFYVERSTAYNAATGLCLALNTLPDKAYVATYSAQLIAPAVTSFADTRETLVPFGYEATILFPMVRWRFSSWPQAAFNKDDTKPEYDSAKAMLTGLNPGGYQSTVMELQN